MSRILPGLIFILSLSLGAWLARPSQIPRKNSIAVDCNSNREPASSSQCQQLFLNEQDSEHREWIERQRAYALESGSHYAPMDMSEVRMSAIKNGAYEAWTVEERHNSYMNQSTLISKFQTIRGPKSINVPAPMEQTLPLERSLRLLDFVIETYRARRPHWTPDFLLKLRRIAEDYLHESTYISVESHITSIGREILGTLRLIRERDGLLPMERYLGIKIDVGGRLKVEPGNFAIRKDANPDAWPEVMMQLASDAVKNIDPSRQNQYLTYADVYSKALYSQLGFTPVPFDRIQLPPHAIIRGNAIVVDGIEWTPMEASQEKLDRLLDIHLKRLAERGHASEELQTLQSRRHANRNPGRRYVVSSATEFNGEKFRAGCQMTRNSGTSLWINKFENGEWVRTESVDLGYFERNDLPFHEGQSLRTWDGRSDSSLVYSNGTLTRKWKNLITEIDISPDASTVLAVRLPLYGKLSGLQFTF